MTRNSNGSVLNTKRKEKYRCLLTILGLLTATYATEREEEKMCVTNKHKQW